MESMWESEECLGGGKAPFMGPYSPIKIVHVPSLCVIWYRRWPIEGG